MLVFVDVVGSRYVMCYGVVFVFNVVVREGVFFLEFVDFFVLDGGVIVD